MTLRLSLLTLAALLLVSVLASLSLAAPSAQDAPAVAVWVMPAR